MKYKASWKFTFGYKYIFVIIIALALVLGIISNEYFLFIIGILLLVYYIILPLRVYVILDDGKMIYQNYFTKSEVLIKDITSIIKSSYFKYPKNKIYSPNTYRICTTSKCFFINTIFYSSNFNQEFQQIIKNIH